MMGTLAAEMIGKWMKEYEGKLLDTADFIFCHPEVSLKEKASPRSCRMSGTDGILGTVGACRI